MEQTDRQTNRHADVGGDIILGLLDKKSTKVDLVRCVS